MPSEIPSHPKRGADNMSTVGDKSSSGSAAPKSTASAAEAIYIDTDTGADDDSADGSEVKPYKSLSYAYIKHFELPPKQYLARGTSTSPNESEQKQWKPAGKATIKKAELALKAHKKKLEAEAEKDQARVQWLKTLEEAKNVVINENKSLPKAIAMNLGDKDVINVITYEHQKPSGSQSDDDSRVMVKKVETVTIELGDDKSPGTRVRVKGRIHRIRQQKMNTFITLMDGYGQLQCTIAGGDLAKTYDALKFTITTCLEVYGTLKRMPPGKVPDDRELLVDYYEVLGDAPSEEDALTNRISHKQNLWDFEMLNNRHLALRGDAVNMMKLRSEVEFAFNTYYHKHKFQKVSPPALVQTQVEGGATLFKLEFFGEEAYLTQSSQLYLETVIPGLTNVYCIEKSFRAEKSQTRRHLAEFTHIEAEMDFCDLDMMMDHVQDLICEVVDMVMSNKEMAELIEKLNPGFKKPERFQRMTYNQAMEHIIKHNILKEDGTPHVYGDDIGEKPEREMVDKAGIPIFLTHFPAEQKAFYMKKDPKDATLTLSMDLLLPNVGEVVGGSMRMDNFDELMAAYKREGIDPGPYYWYTDQRKYGTSPHCGYGLGFERFLAWMAGQHTVRTTCLYPRYMGRCKP